MGKKKKLKKKQKNCPHTNLAHHWDHNSYPYGESIKWDECMKCEKILNFKVK